MHTIAYMFKTYFDYLMVISIKAGMKSRPSSMGFLNKCKFHSLHPPTLSPPYPYPQPGRMRQKDCKFESTQMCLCVLGWQWGRGCVGGGGSRVFGKQ